MTFPLPINPENVGIMTTLGMIQSPEFDRAAMAYWRAADAEVTGGLVDAITGAKSRRLLRTAADTSRPTKTGLDTASRLAFTATPATRLLEGGSLQLLKLTADTVVNLPDGSGTDPGKGITCTGAVNIPGGLRAVMNFGLAVSGSPTTPDPSIAILSNDFTTMVSQILFSSIPSGPSGGAQGLAYDTRENVLVFWANNKFWFVTTAGVLVRTLDFTAFVVNGLAYDAGSDMLVAFATGDNSTLQWIDKATGAVIADRSFPIYGTGLDHIQIVGNLAYISGGNNGGAQGGAIRIVDITTRQTIGEWFTDSGAPEGILVNGSEVWLVDDGWHHSTASTNTARKYTLSPALNTYPGGLRKFSLSWVGNFVSAGAGATALFSIGEPTVSGGRGIGVFAPGSSTTVLRFYFNNSVADFATSTTTEALWFLAVDIDAGNATLWKNGASVGTSTITGLSAVSLMPPMQVMLGATREAAAITRSSVSSLANLFVGKDPSVRYEVEGRLAWDAGRADLLPATHPFKTFRP